MKTDRSTDEAFARFVENGDADPLKIATSASRPIPCGEIEELVSDLRRIELERMEARQ
jgi:hypothetical protein